MSTLKTKTLAVVVVPELHDKVFKFCNENDLKVSEFMRNAMIKEMRNLKRNHGYK